MFVLFVEIRPNHFLSTKVDFIRVNESKASLRNDDTSSLLTYSFRVTFQTQKFACQTSDRMHTLKHASFNLLHPQVPRLELDLILALI